MERKELNIEENFNENGEIIEIVSTISYEDDKEYYLCEDGKFYEKVSDNKYKELDENVKENKRLIIKLRDLFKPGFTDVIEK